MNTAMSQRDKRRLPVAALLIMSLYAPAPRASAGEDVRILLEILLEKGIITQEEFDQKLRKAQEKEDIRAFNESQDIRRANREIDKRAEDERKFKTQFYGLVSAGYYSASNMKSSSIDVSGVSDQPKANNRIGLKVSRELDPDTVAMLTLESNFSSRTGGVGKDAGASGTGTHPIFDREANFRLISKPYGTLILGRGPNLQTDLSGAFDARQNWNFGGLKAIGRYAGFHSASGINRADKMIRYISPAVEGFNLDAAVSFGGVPGDDNYGKNYYLGGRYKNGHFEMGYNHIEARLASNEVNNRVDFIAAKYTLEQVTLNAGYVITRNPMNAEATLSATTPGGKADIDTLFAGAVYRFIPTMSANIGWYQVTDKTSTNGVNDVTMAATGLTWSPYKEWDFFIDCAAAHRKNNANAAFSLYDAWRPDTNNSSTLAAGTKNQSGISIGALFKF
ncbi:MAG: porin [Betaproteobacteria bacterium]|nr:porin [Betaproteobacteria bacterium]